MSEDNQEKKKNENHKAINRAKDQIHILEDTVHKQNSELEELRKENDTLKKEVEKLKQELSAKRSPPHWVKANKKDDPENPSQKKGAKRGHSPNKRREIPPITESVVVFPERCPKYDHELPFPSESKWYTHVQMDLPPPGELIVTEFLVGSSYCAQCKMYHSASHSKISGSLFGPRLHAQVTYWKFELGLTLGKIRGLLLNQYNLDLSTGQLSEIISRSAEHFKNAYDDLKTNLRDEASLHADETGWRVDGKNAWLWSFSSSNLSVYVIDQSRGGKVVNDVLGATFNGVLHSDFYGAYHEIDSIKQKCWAHLLRDLKNLEKLYPDDLEVKYFKSRLKNFFDRAVKLKDKNINGEDIEKFYRRLLSDTDRFISRPMKRKELKTLAKRMFKYRDELYQFIPYATEPTNNNAEREIRPAVLMRKTSYGNRSQFGSEDQAILMSMLRTAKKRNLNFVDFAVSSFMNH